MGNVKTVEIIVSTMNDGIHRVLREFSKYISDSVFVTIIHQITNEVKYDLHPVGFRYFPYFETGLPVSRNRGLENAIGDILIPTDDDVSFDDNFEDTIRAAFNEIPHADIITFKARTPEGEPYKAYPLKSSQHNWRTLLRVSSIEICLKKESIDVSGARWDEDFGLGARFSGGLEVVFLQDCRRKKLSISYRPCFIVRHPAESSGKVFTPATIRLRGAVLSRAFNMVAGVVLSHAFYVKKRRLLSSSGISMFVFSRESILGIMDYIRWSRK